jgi:hypothetical protein
MAIQTIDVKKFESRQGRTIDNHTLVGVHWNAHKKIFSIVSMKSRNSVGLVLGYANQVTLRDCTTKIDKSKQKKVIESGVKDRHAFIVGYIENLEVERLEKNIYYSPKKVSDFVDAEKLFKCGEKKFIEHVDRVNLDFDHENNHPVVTYNN